VDELLAEYGGSNPGATVLVMQHGDVLLRQSYGLADCISGVCVEAGTNFRLASVTKQFTAVATLLLRDDGKLDLSDSLCDIFPDFPAYGGDVEVHHLLQHTSGLRDYFGLLTAGRTEQVSDAEVLQMMHEQTGTDFAPGSAYEYSNTGYCVLAEIIAAVSGQSYSSFLADRIFRPLGMTHTVAHAEGFTAVPHRALGHSRQSAIDEWQLDDQSLTSATLGDGGVYTSVDDLVRWERLWLSAGNNALCLPPSTISEILTPGVLRNGKLIGYGYGWRIGSGVDGRILHSHTGSTRGFRNVFLRYPQEELSVAVLTNRDEGEPETIALHVAATVLAK
jgi:CubicO group peptidase (beta-lactamase class C family)